jgi:hypothetical protein
MVHKKRYEALLRNVCGVFLTMLLLGPMGEITWDFDFRVWKDAVSDGNKYISYGTSMAQQAREQCISENLEAYILDKAGRDNISLTVTSICGVLHSISDIRYILYDGRGTCFGRLFLQ